MLNALDQVGAEHPKRLSFVPEIKGAEGMWRARKGDHRAICRIPRRRSRSSPLDMGDIRE